MTKFTKLRVHGAPIGFHHSNSKRATSCATGGLYKTPSSGQTVSSDDQFTIAWDPTCLDTEAVDIYLYAPEAATPRIHLWETVAFKAGSYQTQIKPRWWNATSSVHLQLRIVEAGQPPFLTTLPAGPVFTATYSAPASGETPQSADTSVVEGGVEVVDNVAKEEHGIQKGRLAAAVLIPLLIVIAIASGVYIWIKRKKGKEDRKRWSQAVDKRMSRISTDWKPVSTAGASEAIRASMAVGDAGNRASSFSFGQIRPSSTVAVESGHAGIGAQGLQSQGIDTTTPQMSQLRSGPRINTTNGERVSRISRVSFAADVRPSVDSRRSQYTSRSSRAFHVGHLPPLPVRQDSDLMSPTQAAGPLSLTADDIRARMSNSDAPARPSVDEMMPALTMMRTGLVNNDDLLLPAKTPTPEPPMPSPPAPTHQAPKSSIVGIMPMQPMPASVMSPDEMLRAYAERRALASPPPTPGAPAMPAPVANYNGNGMRTLYTPATPESPQSAYRKSLAPTENSKYEDDDAYVGTAA